MTTLVFAAAAYGNVVISVENNVPAAPGTTASVGVFAYTTASDQLQGFDLPVDVNNNGHALIPGLTFNAAPIQMVHPNLFLDSFETGANDLVNQNNGGIDGIVNASYNPLLGPIVLGTAVAPTHLFDIVFDISPTLGGVTVPISIITDTFPLVNLYSVTTTPSTSTSVTSGSLVISAVPESSMLIHSAGYLLVASVIGFRLFRWRFA